ncbi:hypothetical protein BELL_1373g00020 [Botrytis elliptica]|uniref:J domain-containing protein n=1 Tax=Botrytis elliptica TaxID=278938 RepID=A0A4Z1I5M7_9HELO|nr:hypothetical protein BELL_1373g00020 [Botrytis elliptica]
MSLTRSRMSNTLSSIPSDIQSAFKLLNISPYNTSTMKEIRSAYLKKAFLLHPDRNPGKDTTVAMQDLHYAYQLLQTHINGEAIEPCQDPIKIIIHKWNLQQQEIFRKQERELRIIDKTRKIMNANLAREAPAGKDITRDLEEISVWASRRHHAIREATQRELKQGEEDFNWNLNLKEFQLEIISFKEDITISGFCKFLGCFVGLPLLLTMWELGVRKALREFMVGGLVISVSLGLGAWPSLRFGDRYDVIVKVFIYFVRPNG